MSENVNVSLGDTVPSLMPGSVSMYALAQFRVVGSGRFRVQGSHNGKTWETDTIKVTPELRAWVNALPDERVSIAGTATKYAECRIRPDGTGTRFQAMGPKLNREWGAEFILPGWQAPHLEYATETDPTDPEPETPDSETDDD